jgi:hypothetical protein
MKDIIEAAFVGGFNTIGAPTSMTWSVNAGLSKFSVMLRNTARKVVI